MKRTQYALPLLGLAFLVGAAEAQVQVQVQEQPVGKASTLRIAYPVSGNYSYLAQQPAVKEDIKLTKKQEQQLQEAQQKQQKAVKDLQQAGGFNRQAYQKINQQYQKDVEAVLTKEQTKRLEQIQFQQSTNNNPLQIFQNPTYTAKLKITPEQLKKALEINQDRSAAQQSLPQTLQRQDRSKFYQELNEATKELMIETLNKDQQAMVKDMEGEPFKGLNNNGGGRGGIQPVQPLPGRPIRINPIQIKPIQIKPIQIQPIKPKNVLPVKPIAKPPVKKD